MILHNEPNSFFQKQISQCNAIRPRMIRTAQHSTLFHSDLKHFLPLFLSNFFLSFFQNPRIYISHTQNHIPSQSLLILRIYLTRLCEFSFEFGEIFFAFFGVEVDDEGIDHFFLLSFSFFSFSWCCVWRGEGRRKSSLDCWRRFLLVEEVEVRMVVVGECKVSKKEEERKEVTFPTRVILVPQGEVSALDVFSSQGTYLMYLSTYLLGFSLYIS